MGAGAVGMHDTAGVPGGHVGGTAGGAGNLSVFGAANPGDNPTPNQPANPLNPNPANPNLMQNITAPATQPTAFNTPAQPIGQALGQNNPPVSFEDIARQNVQAAGQQDEIRRIIMSQDEMRKEFELLRKATEAKETEMRQLQTSLGEMRNENDRLKDENDSKSNQNQTSLLDSYSSDALGNSSGTRSLLDLNNDPPSEIALEGTLTILKTMHARPLEFSGDTQVIDLLRSRPMTRFSEDVMDLSTIGIDPSILEHAFFSECYLKFHTDPNFCQNGIMANNATVVSLPPRGTFPPRASVLKEIPRKFRRMF
jgi:hypothetical protein